MAGRKETFGKNERLCSRKIITGLMENGHTLYLPFYKVIWEKTCREMTFPAQVAFSVPRKIFSGAVTRNLIKRRMREAYRRHKYALYDFLNSENLRLVFIIIFRDSNVPDYTLVEKSMRELIGRLRREAGKKD